MSRRSALVLAIACFSSFATRSASADSPAPRLSLAATSDPRSVEALEHACQGGELHACGMLASRFVRADGVAQDYARAVTLNERACDGGDGLACTNLGSLAMHGHGMPQDDARAAHAYERACGMHDATACASATRLRANATHH